MRGNKLLFTVLLCATTSSFAGVKERVIAACQKQFTDNHKVFQCVQSTDDVQLIRFCGRQGGSEQRVLRCIKNGGLVSVPTPPVFNEPPSEKKQIRKACKQELYYDQDIRKCKQVASSVEAVKFCSDQYRFDSNKLDCITKVANAVNEQKKMKVIAACNSNLYDTAKKLKCIEIAKNKNAVNQCAQSSYSDQQTIKCLKKKNQQGSSQGVSQEVKRACRATFYTQAKKQKCMSIAKNANVVQRCDANNYSEQDIMSCIKRKSQQQGPSQALKKACRQTFFSQAKIQKCTQVAKNVNVVQKCDAANYNTQDVMNCIKRKSK